MESDVKIISDKASELHAALSERRRKDEALCKCDACSSTAEHQWERTNFVKRGTAALHLRKQRERKKQPAPAKGSNADQSFWKAEELVYLFRQEALQALREEADLQPSPSQEPNSDVNKVLILAARNLIKTCQMQMMSR
ncbi:TPA: hypothetical protein ACH3X1_009597 [Trebouxia sp. C0004]